MLANTHSMGLYGIDAYPIIIEVDVSPGLPVVTMVGLPDAVVRESRDRIKAAIRNSGFSWPADRITISLLPAEIKKEGLHADLAIAIGILIASEQLPIDAAKNTCFTGNLSLDGTLQPVRSILPQAGVAKSHDYARLIVAPKDAKLAALIAAPRVFSCSTLAETVALLRDAGAAMPVTPPAWDTTACADTAIQDDMAEIKGNVQAKRALEIAAAGFHNILFVGPPGSGKTMLARRLTGILPELTLQEALEITALHAAAGGRVRPHQLVRTRPFRSPHHSASRAAVIGGGNPPRPGEISLAHRGVLFLDELPEFRRECLESLRQPMEEERVTICRVGHICTLPASCIVAAALNPCPCGHLGDRKIKCRCNATQIAAYRGKISGPLLERIDLHVEVPAVSCRDLAVIKPGESTSTIRARVMRARQLQRGRQGNCAGYYNSRIPAALFPALCPRTKQATELLYAAIDELGLSARAHDRVIRVARTIADLQKVEVIAAEHIAEAIQYRCLDHASGQAC